MTILLPTYLVLCSSQAKKTATCEVREFITRHTAYNKHDTGWAKGAPSEDHTLISSVRFLLRFANGATD
jgi:hypothetical protein